MNQKRHGHGAYEYKNKFFRYEGEWVEGRKHGTGTLMLGDGGSYSGEFSNGEITGTGTRVWPDGTKYTGEFVDGEKHGDGILEKPSGERYEGTFAYNKRHGHGVLLLPSGDKYTGDFVNHRQEGSGRVVCSNGNFYTGQWQGGRYHGRGDLTIADGSAYSGEWQFGKRHGEGMFVGGADGLSMEGKWENDEPLGVGEQLQIVVDAGYVPPEGGDGDKGKKKGGAKKKKGAAAEPPPNYHGRAFLRVVAGQPLPSFTVNSVYVVAEEAEDGAGKDNGGEEDGKGDDGEAKLPPLPATAVATGESGRRWLLTLYKLLPGDGEPGEDGALPEPRLEAVPMEVPPEVPDAAGDSQDEGKDDAGDGGKQDDAPSAKEAEGEDGEEQPAVPPSVAVPNFGGTCAAGTAAVQSGSLILPKTLEPGHYVLAAADRTAHLSFGKRLGRGELPLDVLPAPEEG